MIYRKTETGWLLIIMMVVVIGFLVLAFLYQWGDNRIPLFPFLFLTPLFVVVFLLFYQLTVAVRNNKITLVYGIGLIRISITMDQLLGAEPIKTPWYWGLGIRLTPQGKLYNIQSLQAVRIAYKQDGKEKTVMIGTPEPEKLSRVLKDSIGISAP